VSLLQRAPSARLAAALVLVGLLLLIDVASGPQIRIGGLMVAVPALSAVFLGPGQVLLVTVASTGCVVVAAAANHTIDSENFPVVMATVVLISAGSVAASAVRQRREQQLAQARWVATVTQRVLLRPLPGRLGPLTLASTYMAAEEEAAIGGDLYASASLDAGDARLIVGDVQGKGLGAVEVAGFLLTAFRRASRRRISLRDLPSYLDRGLREDLADLDEVEEHATHEVIGGRAAPRSGPTLLEGFVTAVMVDVTAAGDTIRVANCGHPPPLLLHQNKVLHLDPVVPALPLGLGDLGPEIHCVDRYDLDVGDILLLYTDGVIESRNAEGAFYPLADRLTDWEGDSPDELLRHIRADLRRHAGARLGDDVAMVAAQRWH
jgi:hypothetical protein